MSCPASAPSRHTVIRRAISASTSKATASEWWGDCAHHQVASLARPDWHCVFDVDKEQAAKTRARMFNMVAGDRVAVSGFHMPFPSIGYIERRPDGGYRWLTHSYQLID